MSDEQERCMHGAEPDGCIYCELTSAENQLASLRTENKRMALECKDAKKRMWDIGKEADDLQAENKRLREAVEEVRLRMERFGKENRERPHSYIEGKEAGLHDAVSILERALRTTSEGHSARPGGPELDRVTRAKAWLEARVAEMLERSVGAQKRGCAPEVVAELGGKWAEACQAANDVSSILDGKEPTYWPPAASPLELAAGPAPCPRMCKPGFCSDPESCPLLRRPSALS